ncbi:sensor histidine kinase [Roseateles oligotrophus]|uniref:histidine kinase n=1 Tax=Roseateles oligotrophus TaxID=1769250 RepID=A0ABT2YIQ8_9BURK|nr:histidine kinase [Roseateles oligotrophus]MCV2369952.1 histidine kinase [Roseateles oligotrophus]
MKQAFFSIFKLRVIGAMVAISLLWGLARALAWYKADGPLADRWLQIVIGYSGLALLPGLFILLSAACAEASLVWLQRRYRVSARAAWVIRVGLVLLGLVLAMLLRLAWLKWRLPTAELLWGFFLTRLALYGLFGSLAYAVLVLSLGDSELRARIGLARRQGEALRTQQMEAEMAALNAQIEPHFLFNTLATARRLYATTPDRGRDMLGSLIAYLRAALPGMREQVSSLGQELDLLRNYLHILQMRMGERLRFDIAADAELLALRLPPLILATLVENAIKHGLGPLTEGGQIQIVAKRGPALGEVVLEVRDNGAGFSGATGSGVGLANTRARLRAYFGDRASLELEAAQPRGMLARIRLPWPQEVRP